MLRAVKFILIAAVVLLLAWWIGGLPGSVSATSGSYTVETSVPAALLLLFLIALLFTVLLRVAGGLRRAPGGLSAWRGGRRHRLGEVAVQRGLVALAAEDAKAAWAEAGRAKKLLGDTPLVLLITAEAARLAGKAAEAQTAFGQLSQHEEMGFLGHRGLLRHHLEQGDHEAAKSHAAAAEVRYPGSAWVRARRLELALREQDFRAALGLTQAPAEVAALATAAAQTSTGKGQALSFAKQAVKADPKLAPAVVALAQALRDAGKPRAASKTLRAGWAAAPNPLIAQAYLAPVNGVIEQVQAAAELAAENPGHAESELLLAQTSLHAALPAEARRHVQAAIAAGATDARARDVLASLEGNPPGGGAKPAWVCSACHTPQENWAAVCPACHKPGTLAWQTSAPAA
ncbi:heme biosynthesis HemY N-terminal domain-containing protein [Acidocella sp.]|uniref:heme biosynthesis HemY N-terminal domain-containing protein n=1 Tax=Acidocella sp. TaxID=50710 RepID=UPI0026111232|nr:heme biosynthesis HemY N-terminal domain-containing protein [Acidocella sp.]MDD2794498.1 heme biosynthesis HemY N-terminal domain-containing protein [Acidocella sp.]